MIYFLVLTLVVILKPMNIKAIEYRCSYRVGSTNQVIILSVKSENGTIYENIYTAFTRGGAIAKNIEVSIAPNTINAKEIASNSCPQKLRVNVKNILGTSYEVSKDSSGYLVSYEITLAKSSAINDNEILSGYSGPTGNLTFTANDSIIASGDCPDTSTGVFSLFKIAYNLLKIISPIALVIFGMIDMAKAVTSSDESKMKKAQSSFIRRIVASIIVFLSFVIIEFIIKLSGNWSDVASCISKMF